MICLEEKNNKTKENEAVEKYSYDLIKNMTLDSLKKDIGKEEKFLKSRLNEHTATFFKWR